jgi:hypothetical protein
MRAYRKRKKAGGYKQVSGWAAVQPFEVMVYSDHRLLDARSLALHCRIASKISRNPDLLAIPRRNLQRWKQRAAGKTPKYLLEWGTVLDQPWPAIAIFITSGSEKAERLRQSSPFAGVLDPEERKRIYDAFRA